MSDNDLSILVSEIRCLAEEAGIADDTHNRVRVIARLASIHELLMRHQTVLYPAPTRVK